MTETTLPRPISFPWKPIGLLGLLLGLWGAFSTLYSNTFNVEVQEPSSLTYQEGGDPGNVADPALDVPAASRRYVCSNGGFDGNDGLTQGTAWANISKVNSSWNQIPDNAIITLCRGGTWPDGSAISNKAGATNQPTAIGAYGACTPSPYFDNMCSNAPRVNGTLNINQSSWLTVRDLSVQRFDTSFGTNNTLVYRIQAKGSGATSNVFRAFGKSYNMVFVENIATDADSNDYYSAHQGGGTGNEDGWWFIDNICMGNGGEDCVDLANSEADQGNTHITLDSKVFVLRAIGHGLPGYSSKTGTSDRCMNSGHDGKYYWFVGMVCVGWDTTASAIWSFGSGQNFGPEDKEYAQISGNMAFAETTDAMRSSAAGLDIFHNTLISGNDTGFDINITSGFNPNTGITWTTQNPATPDQYNHVNYNILAQTSGGGGSVFETSRAITTMDNNWFGLNAGKSIDGQLLAARQAGTAFDQNSDEGSIDGFTVPTAANYPNPNDWFDTAFMNDITPNPSWAGCDGANTPGALDCNGNWLGWEWNAISGAPNGGCGWGGLPIVAVKLDELGVTGNCR